MPSAGLNVDLHCHSTISDGVLAPAEVAARAAANGVEMWALTDHDEISGIPSARAAALDLGMRYITGVEISVTWANKTIHIVGLNFDDTNSQLIAGLAATRQGREERAKQISGSLAKAGIAKAFDGALKYVGNPDLISRSHFARFLVEIGIAENVSDVFKKYLAEGKPGFVPHRWATLSEAVGWITRAGGTAVIAHPGRYDLSPVAFGVLFNEFLSLGGTGIEIVTGSHTPDQYEEYATVAANYGFLGSRGSDFHSPDDFVLDLGRLPAHPKQIIPVWNTWL